MQPKERYVAGELRILFFKNITQYEVDLFVSKYCLKSGKELRWKTGSPFQTYEGFGGILQVPKGKEQYYLEKLRHDWLIDRAERVLIKRYRKSR